MSEKLQHLCQGVTAISPGIEIRLKTSESEPDKWSVVIAVGDAILIYTDYVPFDDAIDVALVKLAHISSRMMAAVRQKSEPPPPEGK